MTKKMSKPDKAMLIAVIVIAVLAAGTFIIKQGFKPLAILPELDNRINYFDKKNDMTQFVQISSTEWENDKFYYSSGGSSSLVVTDDNIIGGDLIRISCNNIGQVQIFAKKDFARLKTYLRLRTYGGGGVAITDGYAQLGLGKYLIAGEWINYEILPDNLNVGTYYLYVSGQFVEKVENWKKLIFLAQCTQNRENIDIDYIKYVPIESYSIKNDEVWVKEVRGSSYSFADLKWEMIGYHSEIRPATIRDLTAQTEVPAPQIYINLINNLLVTVQPNTVHTFFYKTKWVSGLDSSCQGQLDKVEVKGSDGTWHCESYVKETPIIQQCQTKADCPILPECVAQKNLINCNNNLCDFSAFSPACKNQLITYQEKVIEIENTKFVPIISGTNSFYCFFDKTKSSCQIGEKTISVTAPSYVCTMPSDSSTIVSTGRQGDECWQSTLSFDNKNYVFKTNEKKDNVGFNIKAEISMSGSLDSTRKLRDGWGIAGKFTLPDNFLDLKVKNAGNKFVLQNSIEPITFTIINNLGFGINGGYAIQTQNTALEGGVVIRDETKNIFLNSGENDITYSFKTEQLGSIADIILAFGKIITDREYIMKSSSAGREKYLVITKEVKTEIPSEIEKVQPKIEIVERIVEKPVIRETTKEVIPAWIWLVLIIIILFAVGFLVWKRYGD